MDIETFEKINEELLNIRLEKNLKNWGKSDIMKLNNPVIVRDATGKVMR